MSSRLEEYVNLPYSVRVVPDRSTGGELVYLAFVEELPGCESHGDTAPEAARNLRDALELYLESLLEEGLDPPEPKRQIETVVWTPMDRISRGSVGKPVQVVSPASIALAV